MPGHVMSMLSPGGPGGADRRFGWLGHLLLYTIPPDIAHSLVPLSLRRDRLPSQLLAIDAQTSSAHVNIAAPDLNKRKDRDSLFVQTHS